VDRRLQASFSLLAPTPALFVLPATPLPRPPLIKRSLSAAIHVAHTKRVGELPPRCSGVLLAVHPTVRSQRVHSLIPEDRLLSSRLVSFAFTQRRHVLGDQLTQRSDARIRADFPPIRGPTPLVVARVGRGDVAGVPDRQLTLQSGVVSEPMLLRRLCLLLRRIRSHCLVLWYRVSSIVSVPASAGWE